jgi:FtsZ-binding cell division protein ZapB
MLNEYEQRVEKTMEELALLQIELEESKESNQEQVARLKGQLK